MGEHHEVRYERLYVREPGTERLRKGAEGRLKHLLATGWREVERWHTQDYVTVRVERSGVVPRMTRMPKIEAPPPRAARSGFGRGGPGGGRGGFGGRGGPGGGPGGPPGGGRP
jgi:hypothetical protein